MTRKLVLVLCLLLVGLCSLTGCRDRVVPEAYAFGTGTKGGTFNQFGQGVAAAFMKASPDGTERRLVPQHTEGTIDNIEKIASNEIQVAMISGHGLAQASEESLADARIVADLYPSFLQVVARLALLERVGSAKDLSSVCTALKQQQINDGEKFEPVKIYLGANKSAVYGVGREILRGCGLDENTHYVIPSEIEGYRESAQALIDGSLDVAILFAGLPTPATSQALESGLCCLIPPFSKAELPFELKTTSGEFGQIRALTYPGLQEKIATLEEHNYLVAGPQVNEQVVRQLVGVLATEIDTVRFKHQIAAQVRLSTLIPAAEEVNGCRVHDAAREAHELLKNQLTILSGSSSGTYYHMANKIAKLLRRKGIPCHVEETNGSKDNIQKIANSADRPLLALVQHDTLFTQIYEEVYGMDSAGKIVGSNDLESLESIRYIAPIQEEFLFAFSKSQGSNKKDDVATLSDLVQRNAKRVVTGGAKSGTSATLEQLFGKEITGHSDIPTDRAVEALELDLIDAAVMFTAYDNAVVQALFARPSHFLPIDLSPLPILQNRNPALQKHEFPLNMQSDSQGSIRTVRTRTILVCNPSVQNVSAIAKAVFEAPDIIGTTSEFMIQEVEGIDRHERVTDLLEHEGLIATVRTDYRELLTWAIGVLIGIATLFGTVIVAWNGLVAHSAAQDILAVSLGPENPDSVHQLAKKEEDIRNKIGNVWFKWGVVSPARWSSLQNLIELRMASAQASTFRDILGRLRECKSKKPADPNIVASFDAKALHLLENGEISLEQFDTVSKLVDESQVSDTYHETDSVRIAPDRRGVFVKGIRNCLAVRTDNKAVLDDKEGELEKIENSAWELLESGSIDLPEFNSITRLADKSRSSIDIARASRSRSRKSTT